MKDKRKRRRLGSSIIAGAALLLALPALCSGAEPAAVANPDSALAVALAGIEGTPITFEEALGAALRNAPASREAELGLDAARATVRREKGAFDPEVFGSVDHSKSDQPTSSPFSGADVLETKDLSLVAGSRIRLPFGTEIEASLTGTKTETNSSFASLDPQYESYGVVELRQPLLKGSAPSARQNLHAAERELDASRALYEDARAAVRGELENTYWSLYAAERDFAVSLVIRDRARAFLDETRLRADAGVVGPGEVASARVFLAQQEQIVLDREESLDGISDALATLVGRRPGAASPRFLPADAPPTDYSAEPVEVLVDRAIRANGSITAAEARVEALRARLHGAKWDAFPALDLRGSIGGAGLAGTARDVEFGGVVYRSERNGAFADTWDQVFHRDYPNWAVGLELTIPIGFREGAGERDRIRAEVNRAEEELRAAKLDLEESVRAAERGLSHGRRRLEAAREGVDAAGEQVRIGLIEYRAGRATAFELVRLGADLATAEQRYSEALVKTAKAAAALRRLAADTDTRDGSRAGE